MEAAAGLKPTAALGMHPCILWMGIYRREERMAIYRLRIFWVEPFDRRTMTMPL